MSIEGREASESSDENLEHPKIVAYEHIGELAQSLKQAGSRLVLASGGFDILHPGHFKALSYFKGLGHILIVGIDSDETFRIQKGKTPVQNQQERAFNIANATAVDVVTIFDDIFELVRVVRPNVLVASKTSVLKTEDREKEFEFVRTYGGEVLVFEAFYGIHTSHMIAKIRNFTGTEASI